MDDGKFYLIVGLGNPGVSYERTRHNVGFNIVRRLADQLGGVFKSASHLTGDLAQLNVHGKKVLLLLPTTFMNASGDAVRRCKEYYGVPFDQVLVVCDDIALPLGTLRMRTKGSPGGHNGLKSIEAHLNTEHYARLRIGISAPGHENLADYVLGKFSQEESAEVQKIAARAVEVLELWINKGIAAAMQAANASV